MKIFLEPKNQIAELEKNDIELTIESYIDQILDPKRRTGKDQRGAWELGWGEIANEYKKTKSLKSLLPQYFNKNIFRYKHSFFSSNNENLEADFIHNLIEKIVGFYFKENSEIIELGCGTGHNLVHLTEKFPESNFIGFEYASSAVELIKEYSNEHNLKISPKSIDYYKCDGLGQQINISQNKKIIYTCASMEQLNTYWQPLYKELSKIKNSIFIHIEPFSEIYDQSSIVDMASLSFHHARGYLSGYASFLELQAQLNNIKLVTKHRTSFGTTYHEPYNVLVWKNI